MKKITKRLKLFYHTFDPGFFSMIYALKALFAVLLSVILTFVFVPKGIVWALISAPGIFFLNSLEGSSKEKILMLLGYLAICIFMMFLFNIFLDLGIWLFVPTFFWLLFVLMSESISKNLSKILLAQCFAIFLAIVAKQNGMSDFKSMIYGFLIGGVSATFIRELNFKKYGRYTIKQFNIILSNLSFMAENFYNSKFDFWLSETISSIASTKYTLSKKSANTKDSTLVKHQERAVFYLYKTKEMVLALNSLRMFFLQHKESKILKEIQDEILENISRLKEIFLKDKEVTIKKNVFEKIKNDPRLAMIGANLQILYYSFDMFAKGGHEQIELKVKKNKITFKKFISLFTLKNEHFKYSLKFSVAVALSVFIAFLFNIDHGLWIALGVMSVMRANTNLLQIATKDAIIGSIFGVLIGIPLIFFTKGTALFLPLILLVTFLIFYTKNFSYKVWSAVFMVALCILYSFLKDDFTTLLLARVFDMVIGFVVAIFISVAFWQRKSKDEIIPKIEKILDSFRSISTQIANKQENSDFFNLEQRIINDSTKLSDLIKQSKKERYKEILSCFDEINLSLLNLYSYIQKFKNKNDELTPQIIQNDVTVLSRRFEMIDAKIKNIAHYFYGDVSKIFRTKDPKFLFLMKNIANSQEKIYRFFD